MAAQRTSRPAANRNGRPAPTRSAAGRPARPAAKPSPKPAAAEIVEVDEDEAPDLDATGANGWRGRLERYADGGAGALGWVTFVFGLIGVGLSSYLTYEHETGAKSFACPANSHINCEKVTTSAWSHLAGMPVAILGLAFFVGMTLLLTPYAWRFRQLDWLRVLGVLVGIGTALYLVWAEAFRIKAICLYCTGVHIVSLILLVLVLFTTSEVRARVRA